MRHCVVVRVQKLHTDKSRYGFLPYLNLYLNISEWKRFGIITIFMDVLAGRRTPIGQACRHHSSIVRDII